MSHPIDHEYAKWTAERAVGCTLEEYRALFDLTRLLNPKCLLEIGPGTGASTQTMLLAALPHVIQVTLHAEQSRLCVDPNFFPWVTTFEQSSDAFFESHEVNPTSFYDLVFIDGDHTEEVVDRDLKNSIAVLRPGGIIVAHDVRETCMGFIENLCKAAAKKAGLSYRTLDVPGNGLGVLS